MAAFSPAFPGPANRIVPKALPSLIRALPLSLDRRRVAIILVFAIHGSVVGSFFLRIAELQAGLGLSKAVFGVALMASPAGFFVASLFTGRLIERLGTRRALLFALTLFSLAPLLGALAVGVLTFSAALFVLGFGLSTGNIAMNVEADRVEAATKHRILNRCHGTWAVGSLLASLIGTGVVAAGIAPRTHFLLLFILLTIATFAVVWPMQPSPARPHRGATRRKIVTLPTVNVLLIVGFACSGIWIENSARNWSVIYLRDLFSAPDWVATLTLPAYVVAQIVGRFLADTLIERFGQVGAARGLTVVSLVGLLVIALVQSVPFAVAGFAILGLGLSTVYPQALSAVARLSDRPSFENVAAFSTLQTIISFVSPPFFGFVASRFGIQTSFAVLLPLPIMAFFFARFLAPSDWEQSG